MGVALLHAHLRWLVAVMKGLVAGPLDRRAAIMIGANMAWALLAVKPGQHRGRFKRRPFGGERRGESAMAMRPPLCPTSVT